MRTILTASLGLSMLFILTACGEPVTDADLVAAESAHEEASRFTVVIMDNELGGMDVTPTDDGYEVFYEYRNNGRGPTFNEVITLGENGLPVSWSVEGASTFGNQIDEDFTLSGGEASWTDATGSGERSVDADALYVTQSGSPYSLAIAARYLMNDEDGRVDALPGGQVSLTEMESLSVEGPDGEVDITTYALSGTSTSPTYFAMADEAFFAVFSPSFLLVEEGYEGSFDQLTQLAANYGAARYEQIQADTKHSHDGPVRIRDVRIFDSVNGTLGELVSLVYEGNRIIAIDAPDAESLPNELVVQGEGGTLVPGLFDMHGHLGESSAMLNVVAGVTSVRDMGNNNEVLSALIEKIEAGEIAGPRVYRSGFIEGRSEFNSNNGILVTSQEEAVEAVRTYAASGDFHQIKIYNSMNPDWVPAMIEEAHNLGLRVAGHVPAFTNADAMIMAGYDEMTHINQIMLGWVLEEGEDTRTLLRLTALKRLPDLDLMSEPVLSTINEIAERGIAVDPTFAIHEALLLGRNGELARGVTDYIDNMPVDSQRSARTAWAAIDGPEDDAAYRGAYDQIVETLRMMHERGILLVPGTDLGGGFTLHRELELYQQIGMSPAEILSWASYGMADYLGVSDELGSIEVGKLTDFFLIPGDPTADLKAIKTISMVVSDDTAYFPAEVYPHFGIQPFIDPPAYTVP